MPAFHTDQLTTLLALFDEGTFERAAARLHITASAVSQRIKAMEQTAAQILVQRTNPVVPTTAGDIVLRHARQVALLDHDTSVALGAAFGDSSDSAAADGRAAGTGTAPPVSIAIAVNADSLGTWFLPSLARLADTLNAVFDLHRDDEEHTTALLRSGTVLAAVTSTLEPVQGCTSELLGIMRYRAVCSPAFAERWRPSSGDPSDEFAWLAAAPMLSFDRKDELQSGFARARLTAATHPPTHYIPTTADFARATLLGLGWSLLPEQQCLTAIADGMLVELDPGHPVDVPLYWQRWNLDSPTLAAVTDAIRTQAARSLTP